jgi:hypothetical protein
MDYSRRRIVRIPKILVLAKAWKVQIKIIQEISRSGDETGKISETMNIFHILN